MTDPLLDPEHREFEDGLLRAGRDVHMSRAAREKTFAALGIGAAGIATAGTAKAASAASWWSSKAAVVVVAGAVGVGGVATGVALHQMNAEEVVGAASVDPGVESSKSSDTSAQDVATQKADDDATAFEVPAEPSTPPGEAKPAASASTREVANSKNQPSKSLKSAAKPGAAAGLGEELAAIGRVEAALQSGQASRALSLLSEYRKQFPRPRLGLEAEVLQIQALSDSGAKAAASSRAKAFVARHPSSPLGAKAKQYIR